MIGLAVRQFFNPTLRVSSNVPDVASGLSVTNVTVCLLESYEIIFSTPFEAVYS
jgi:hypothetical protein